ATYQREVTTDRGLLGWIIGKKNVREVSTGNKEEESRRNRTTKWVVTGAVSVVVAGALVALLWKQISQPSGKTTEPEKPPVPSARAPPPPPDADGSQSWLRAQKKLHEVSAQLEADLAGLYGKLSDGQKKTLEARRNQILKRNEPLDAIRFVETSKESMEFAAEVVLLDRTIRDSLAEFKTAESRVRLVVQLSEVKIQPD